MLGVFPERDQELGGLHQIFLIEFAFRKWFGTYFVWHNFSRLVLSNMLF